MGVGNGLETVFDFCVDVERKKREELAEKKYNNERAVCESEDSEQSNKHDRPYHEK